MRAGCALRPDEEKEQLDRLAIQGIEVDRIPGDSGSGFLDADGRALGTLSTVAVAPLAGSNGVGNLARELDYAQAHSGIAGLHLVRGTEAFSPLP